MKTFRITVHTTDGHRRTVNVAAPSREEAEERARSLTVGRQRVVEVRK